MSPGLGNIILGKPRAGSVQRSSNLVFFVMHAEKSPVPQQVSMSRSRLGTVIVLSHHVGTYSICRSTVFFSYEAMRVSCHPLAIGWVTLASSPVDVTQTTVCKQLGSAGTDHLVSSMLDCSTRIMSLSEGG